MTNTRWDDIYTITDPIKAFNYFENKLKILYNKAIPIKEKLNVKFRNPWLTPSILKSINIKNKLYTSSRNGQSKRDDYKKYQNCLTSVMRKAKLHYYKTLLHKFKNNSSKLWAHMKSILCTNKKSNILLSPNTFNDFFVSVFQQAPVPINNFKTTIPD